MTNDTSPHADHVIEWQEIVVPLTRPIHEGRRGKGKVLHSSVTIYEPDAEALDQLEKAIPTSQDGEPQELSPDSVKLIIVALTDLTPEEVNRLHPDDLMTISERATALIDIDGGDGGNPPYPEAADG